MAFQTSSDPRIHPRIIIHGGAGNIRRGNLPPESYSAYRSALLGVLQSSWTLLQRPGATALDVAVHAVSLLEDNPLFNAGKGAVFTRAGTNELEASVMVSNGYRKRGVGAMLLRHVKNPIKLVREMLVRGEDLKGGGAQGHCQLAGEYLESLASEWGLEMCESEYFFTKRRWDEHMRGLEREQTNAARSGCEQPEPSWEADDPSWDGHEYLPQGTVGAVVLDSFGTVCVATSTGGLTNKLPGRIGDTPTLGAGFWAEEWFEQPSEATRTMLYRVSDANNSTTLGEITTFTSMIAACLPSTSRSDTTEGGAVVLEEEQLLKPLRKPPIRHAVAMSGTGNGDSFLRTNAARTAAAISRFSTPNLPLSSAITRVAGPGGELQKSAGDRWGATGEGEGGIIGIELIGNKGKIVWDLNCGGMFRAWIDDHGNGHFLAFRDEMDREV